MVVISFVPAWWHMRIIASLVTVLATCVSLTCYRMCVCKIIFPCQAACAPDGLITLAVKAGVAAGMKMAGERSDVHYRNYIYRSQIYFFNNNFFELFLVKSRLFPSGLSGLEFGTFSTFFTRVRVIRDLSLLSRKSLRHQKVFPRSFWGFRVQFVCDVKCDG